MIEPGSRVLVTGATGFTGRVVVRQLHEAGCLIRAIARPSSDTYFLQQLGVEVITGEVYDPETVATACQQTQYIFHVAAAYREAGIGDEIYQKVHVASTQLLAKHAAALPDFKRFIHVSTVGVHGHIESPPADESAPFSPGDIYQDTKADAENWIQAFALENRLPLTVIRPAAIFGPGDMRLLKVFKFAKLSIVPLVGHTRGLYHLIHVEDLVRFMLVAAASDEAEGQTYICGNQQATSIKGMVEEVAKHLGRRPRFVRIPASPVFAIARFTEWVCARIGVAPPIYPRRVAFFTKDRSFDTSKMRSLPGYVMTYTNESGIAATCEWYRDNGLL